MSAIFSNHGTANRQGEQNCNGFGELNVIDVHPPQQNLIFIFAKCHHVRCTEIEWRQGRRQHVCGVWREQYWCVEDNCLLWYCNTMEKLTFRYHHWKFFLPCDYWLTPDILQLKTAMTMSILQLWFNSVFCWVYLSKMVVVWTYTSI